MNTKKILFTSDCNGYEYKNPRAHLIELSESITNELLHSLEYKQPGACRMGGSWQKIMNDGNIIYNLLSEGKKSDYKLTDYDTEYKLISGNY